MKKLLLLIAILFSLNIKAQTKEIIGHWMYCDKYTFEFLTLNTDSSFLWHYQSCKGDDDLAGRFVFSNDTIYLKGKDKSEKYLLRDKKIFTCAEQNNEYPDFQPLTPANKKTIRSAYKECCKIRQERYWAQSEKSGSVVSFVTILDIQAATKDGYYLNGYVVTVDYKQAKKINGKKIRVTGEVTVVKGLSNQPGEYDKEGNKIIKQGREQDTKHIIKPSIEVLECLN